MILRKQNPVGIDTTIDAIQTKLYKYFTENCKWVKYGSYHRAYKNEKEGQIIPEIYTNKEEYVEVLYNDKYNGTSFFLSDYESKLIDRDQGIYQQGISAIFQLNIKDLYGQISHRADEEAREEITRAFKLIEETISHEITGIVTGVNKVYEDLKLNSIFEKDAYRNDMGKKLLLRVNLNIKYYYDNCGYNLL